MRIARSMARGAAAVWLIALPALALWIVSSPASAETRGYAISMVHTATYAEQGNCPHGGNGSSTEIHEKILMDQGYSREQAVKMLTGNERKLDFDTRGHLYGQLVDVGVFPTSVPDDHIETVQGAGAGHYMYGFNLAGKVTPDSFEDPETHQMVQNQMWRALGCFTAYQYQSPSIPPYNEGIAWDTAMDSMPAWLLSISGDDLSRDGDVTVTFDRSLDILIRDRRGGVLTGSSYTIDPDPRNHSAFKGHIQDHVLTIEPGNFFMQGESQFYALLRFTQTHLRLKMNPNGSLSGIIGGYQPWLDYWEYVAIRGEEDSEVDIPGVYYALKRLADGVPDTSGHNTAISAAYYLEAVPAYVLERSGKVIGSAYVNGHPLNGVAAGEVTGR
jgi:hypothetical protein